MGILEFGGESLRCELAAGDEPGRCSWCGAALPAGRRRWCSDEHGRAFADQHVWASARLAALERDGYRCREGCASLDLHVHHVTPVAGDGYGPGCTHHLDGLVTLCRWHHEEEHRFMREVETILTWADGTVSRQLALPLR